MVVIPFILNEKGRLQVLRPRSVPFWLPNFQMGSSQQERTKFLFQTRPVPVRGPGPGVGWRASLLHATLSSHPCKCWLHGTAGSGGVAISPSSEAAHLFPGIGRPAPLSPSPEIHLLCYGKRELHGSLPPEGTEAVTAAKTPSRPPGLQASRPHGSSEPAPPKGSGPTGERGQATGGAGHR